MSPRRVWTLTLAYSWTSAALALTNPGTFVEIMGEEPSAVPTSFNFGLGVGLLVAGWILFDRATHVPAGSREPRGLNQWEQQKLGTGFFVFGGLLIAACLIDWVVMLFH